MATGPIAKGGTPYHDAEIAIVGGGFSGSALAINLARHQGPSTLLLHRRPRAGFGLAYSTTDAVHLLNVRAANMSALPDEPDHFTGWITARGLGTGRCFVPRQVYGDYLSALLESCRAAAPARLRLMPADVQAIERTADGFRLRLESGQPIRAGRVVLAMGNLPARTPPGLARIEGDPRYIPDPWSADPASGLEDGDHVLLLGTGLTAIDVALRLAEAGYGGRITALSRRGLLPREHDASPPPPLLAMPPAPSVRAVARHLRAEAAMIGWRQAVDRLRPHTQLLWQRMSLSERRRFLRHARPWWDVHRHRMAPDVARRIERLQEEGRLAVMRGRITGIATAGRGLQLSGRTPDGGPLRLDVRRIINCTGSGDLAGCRDPLIKSLMAEGLARADPLGLGFDTDHVGRVRGAGGAITPGLFAVGPLTRGAFWEITAVPDIRRQVWALARRLADAHWVGGEGL